MPTLAPSDQEQDTPAPPAPRRRGADRPRTSRRTLIARGVVLAVIASGALYAGGRAVPQSGSVDAATRGAGHWLPQLDPGLPGAAPWAAGEDAGSVQSSAGLPPPVRIDAGGDGLSSHGRVWGGDAGFTGGKVRVVDAKIQGTAVRTLFQSERVGVNGYAIPVPVQGRYIVRVYAAEKEATGAGQRVFSVAAEGAPIVKDIDLYEAVGPDVAAVFSRAVTVKDGVLDVSFAASKGAPIVSALEVIAVPISKTEESTAREAGPSSAVAKAPDGATQDDPGAQTRAESVRVAAPRAAAGTLAQQFFGQTRSGLAWHSGFWTGGYKSTDRMEQAGAWRGRQMDVATTYANHSSWAAIADSAFSASTFAGFDGVLAYGLPLLPDDRRGQWSDVTSGAHDDVFRAIARQLVAAGHGDAAIRVGWEANGDWYPWSVTKDTAPQYRDAFRRVVTVMRAEAPNLTFWEDLAAATALGGQSNRMDSLTLLYAGDDVVDGISVDHYDFYSVKAKTETEWKNALRPKQFFGIQDAADFARSKGKGFAVPEWGLHGTQGYGDNPFFIQKMYAFFKANQDVLVFEDYFNEPDDYIQNAIWDVDQNPQSAAMYRKLFGNG